MNSQPPQYEASRLRQALAEDPRTAELGIAVTVRPGHVFLRGDVATERRREVIGEVTAELAPDVTVHNELRVVSAAEPSGEEHLR